METVRRGHLSFTLVTK